MEKRGFFESPWALMLLQIGSAVAIPVILISLFGEHFPGASALMLTMPFSSTVGLLIAALWILNREKKQRLRNVNRILTILKDR